MDDVTSRGTGAGGLGTVTARWAMILVWSCGIVLGLLGEPFTALAPLGATAFAAGLVGVVLLTTPGDRPLPRVRVIWLPLIATYVTAVALSVAPTVEDWWALTFSSYLVTFLFLRGNPVAAGLGSAMVIGYVTLWVVPQEPSLAQYALLLGVPIGSVVGGVVARLVFRRIVHRERAHRTSAARASERSASAAVAIAASQEDLSAIRAVAVPLLARIAAGERIDDDLRGRFSRAEASIRDRIRAPQLQHPRVVDAIERLRILSVDVIVLGEPSPEAHQVDDRLAEKIAELIAPVDDGRVTIRALPAGRDAAVTIVMQTAAGSEQIRLSENGLELTRS